MPASNELKAALIEGARDFLNRAPPAERLPVYQLRSLVPIDIEKQARRIVEQVHASQNLGVPRFRLVRNQETLRLVTSAGVRAQAFYASGAITVHTPLAAHRHFIASQEGQVDREALSRDAVMLFEKLSPAANLMVRASPALEQMAFERLWEIKGSSVLLSEPSQPGPVVTSRAVGAFRRKLHGLPVLGPASVFIKFAARAQLDSLGIDWRPLDGAEPFEWTRFVPPEQAAARLLDELTRERMESEGTIDHYAVAWVQLSYLSLPKRRTQTLLQPAWVAFCRAKPSDNGLNGSLDRLIAVPASPAPLESLQRDAPGPVGASVRAGVVPPL